MKQTEEKTMSSSIHSPAVTFEAIRFPFNEAAVATIKEILKGIAKWDGKRKAWVMPAGTWANMLELSDLGEHIHRFGILPWSEVRPVLDLLASAEVTPVEHMPQFMFSGGYVRQVR